MHRAITKALGLLALLALLASSASAMTPEAWNKPVNINKATATELQSLPGIGPAKAQAILDYRKANGPFRKVDDLINVRGIGQKTLEKLRPLVTVGTPPPAKITPRAPSGR